jgi:TRAP-type C4-dicarboxylate transport system permease small subunit
LTIADEGPAVEAAPRSFLDRFAIGFGAQLSWLFAVSVVVTAYEVVMRYVFNDPTIWVHDLAIALTAICFVFGGAYALARDEHIRITTLHDRMSPRWREPVDLVGNVAIMMFLGGLTWASAHQAWRSILLVETSGRAWDVPVPPVVKAALALGTAVMTVQSALRLWIRVRDARRR